jgi:hypothetical protein
MKRQKILLLAAVVFFVCSPCASKLAFAGYLYGTSYDYSNPLHPFGIPYLCRIDPADGSYVLLSRTAGIYGLAYNNSNEYLYGVGDRTYGQGEFALFRIDPIDGSSDLVTELPWWTRGLAYNSSSGCLYVSTNDAIFSLDPATGSYDLLFSTPELVAGLAYNQNDGQLYGIAMETDCGPGNLCRIDPDDGSFTQVSADPMYVYGLTFNSSNGYLYGTEFVYGSEPDICTLYRIDPTDGSYVLISDNSAPNVMALAYVPEPAAFLLLAFGAIFLRKKR